MYHVLSILFPVRRIKGKSPIAGHNKQVNIVIERQFKLTSLPLALSVNMAYVDKCNILYTGLWKLLSSVAVGCNYFHFIYRVIITFFKTHNKAGLVKRWLFWKKNVSFA
jgi:hypothetical protein